MTKEEIIKVNSEILIKGVNIWYNFNDKITFSKIRLPSSMAEQRFCKPSMTVRFPGKAHRNY